GVSFPVDPDELDAVDLDGCLSVNDPVECLSDALKKLRAIRQTPSLSAESLRRTLTLSIAAFALRELLSGRSESQIAEALHTEGAELRKAGGPIEKKRWGLRV
ncbi:MAG: hypothetical protein AAB229_06950, partial [Candidatus Hydrogenedentota bacterium]